MDFRILEATGSDARLWSALVGRLPAQLRDLHFLPEYGIIYQKTFGYLPRLACCRDGSNFIVQPFVLRRLNELPFLVEAGVHDDFFDIANPYGYGGPLCLDPDADSADALLREFAARLSAWCAEHRIAAEFCSCHPLLANHELAARLGGIEPMRQKEVIYLDLTLSEDRLWRAIHRGHRSSIERARAAGVRVEKVEPSAPNLDGFEALYRATMDRNQAAERWYFPQSYFRDCIAELGQERASLFFARAGAEVVSAYLLLHDARTAYYHFGGSDSRYFALRANNLLMYETALWAKNAGLVCYHLGGGVTARADDSLLQFKARFGGAAATLFTYGRVHHEPTYRRLCELKLAHERSLHGTALETDYFPLYRR